MSKWLENKYLSQDKKKNLGNIWIREEPMIRLELMTGGLQIRFLSSTPSYHRPLRARIERFESANTC